LVDRLITGLAEMVAMTKGSTGFFVQIRQLAVVVLKIQFISLNNIQNFPAYELAKSAGGFTKTKRLLMGSQDPFESL
jgi:hypothetical protein